jgi:hypothetical protein
VEDTAETKVEQLLDAIYAEPVGDEEEQEEQEVATKRGRSPAHTHVRSPSPTQARSPSPAVARSPSPANTRARTHSPSPAQAKRSPSPPAVRDKSRHASPARTGERDRSSPSPLPQTSTQPAHRSPTPPRPGSYHDERQGEDSPLEDTVHADAHVWDADPEAPVVVAIALQRTSTPSDNRASPVQNEGHALATPRAASPPLRSPMPALAGDVLHQPPQNMQTPSPARPATASRSSTPSKGRRLPSPPPARTTSPPRPDSATAAHAMAKNRSPSLVDDAVPGSPLPLPPPPLTSDSNLGDSGASAASAAALRHSPTKAAPLHADNSDDGAEVPTLQARSHTDGLLLGRAGSDMLVTQRTMVIDD